MVLGCGFLVDITFNLYIYDKELNMSLRLFGAETTTWAVLRHPSLKLFKKKMIGKKYNDMKP